ncbi:MAG: hypothetical protein WBW35_12470 [Xanthobacteraceae bacterium]
MRATFDQKLVTASGFLIFCSIAACIVGATNAPGASARGAQTEITTVNRVNKGDQLTASPIQQTQQILSPSAESIKTSLQRPPLGCDPAFSPVADPMRATIYKRCTV